MSYINGIPKLITQFSSTNTIERKQSSSKELKRARNDYPITQSVLLNSKFETLKNKINQEVCHQNHNKIQVINDLN